MRLIYTNTGAPAMLGDIVETFRGERAILLGIQQPHKPASTGRVYIQLDDSRASREFFPSVIGAEWIERGDL
jgi:hypothetical protein